MDRVCSVKLQYLDDILIDIIKKLQSDNEADDLWRCLKYPTSDALDLPITDTDKGILSLQNNKDGRLILKFYNNEIIDNTQTQLRIFLDNSSDFDGVASTLNFGFEILIHDNAWFLDNQKIRANTIIANILNVLNGKAIDRSIKPLDWNGFMQKRYYNGNYTGYSFVLTGVMA